MYYIKGDTSNDRARMMRVGSDGLVTTLDHDVQGIAALTADDCNVYWLTNSALKRIAK